MDAESPTPETAPPVPTPWRRRSRRKEAPARYLLDGRLFRLLCAPEGEKSLEGFRASVSRQGLAPAGGLPPVELTPLAFLEVLGIEPPQIPIFPLPSSVLKTGEHVTVAALIVRVAQDEFRKKPEIQPDLLKRRVEELRRAAPLAAHDLFDLCLESFVSREGFEDEVCRALAYDFLYRFPLPEVLREEVFDFLCASLFDARMSIPGASKMRVIKSLWDRSYELILRGNVGARGEIQTLDRELKPRTRGDYLAWESVHHAILGYPAQEGSYAVTAFTLDSTARATTRCIAYKTALRSLLDQLTLECLADLRSAFEDWKPGSLVPCREDGTFEPVLVTGDLPLYLSLRKAS
jgi:hypothetical protein